MQYLNGGNPFTGDYQENSPSGSALVRCDHVEGPNSWHCLQSWELSPQAQGEGFAQFFASKVFNNPEQNDCTFNYYKQMALPECVPGAAGCETKDIVNLACTPEADAAGNCTRVTSGLTVNKAPVPVSCQTAVRWRNRHAAALTQAEFNEGFGYIGTEWDWMTFFWNLNRDSTRPWLVSEIGDLYESAGARGNTDMAFDFLVLENAVLAQRGEFSAEYQSFLQQGIENGVGDSLDTN